MSLSDEWRERLSVPFSDRATCNYCGHTLVRRGETGRWLHLSTTGRDYETGAIHAATPAAGSIGPAHPPTPTFREAIAAQQGYGTQEEWHAGLQEQQRRRWDRPVHVPDDPSGIVLREPTYSPGHEPSPDAMRWTPEEGEHEMSLWEQMFHDRRGEGRRDRPT